MSVYATDPRALLIRAAARAARTNTTAGRHRLDKVPFGKMSDEQLRELISWYGGRVPEPALIKYAYCYFPRPKMGPGPWAEEPDHAQFESHGLPCLAVRHPDFGSWCGYVGVPPGHPLHGVPWVDDDCNSAPQLEHAPGYCGINYSGPCEPGGLICHEARAGEAEPVWWFGMDFHHAMDIAPAAEFRLRRYGDGTELTWRPPFVYRDLPFVMRCVGELAAWLATMSANQPAVQPQT